MKKLPGHPADLLKLALKDMKKCLKNEQYKIEMGFWHWAQLDTNTCYICIAGAIMAQTLNTPPNISKRPEDFSNKDIQNKLQAIDLILAGDILDGVIKTGKKISQRQENLIRKKLCLSKLEQPQLYPDEMRKLIKLLRKYVKK